MSPERAAEPPTGINQGVGALRFGAAPPDAAVALTVSTTRPSFGQVASALLGVAEL
jgi:hypothetical protein